MITFNKTQVKKAGLYSLGVALIVPFIAAIFYMLSFAPAPIGFGAILGLLAFPFFMMIQPLTYDALYTAKFMFGTKMFMLLLTAEQ